MPDRNIRLINHCYIMDSHGNRSHPFNMTAQMIGQYSMGSCMSRVKQESDAGTKPCKRGNIRWTDCQLANLSIRMPLRTSPVSPFKVVACSPDYTHTVFTSLILNLRHGCPPIFRGYPFFSLLSHGDFLYVGTEENGIYRAEIPVVPTVSIQPQGKAVTTWARLKQATHKRD